MKLRQYAIIFGLCAFAMWHATLEAAGVELSNGRRILLYHGLQIQAQVYPATAGAGSGFSDFNRWRNSNFTTANFTYNSNGYLNYMPAGTTWGRHFYPGSDTQPAEPVELFDYEEPYKANFVSMQYSDELYDFAAPSRVSDMAAKYTAWHNLYPNTLVYTNFSTGPGSPDHAALVNYMADTKPDMIMFDWYTGYPDGFNVSGSTRGIWYSQMQTYRTTALAGNDGTGRAPIPYGQYLYMFRPSYSSPLPSESFVRLQQNASWAFGYTFVDALVYNDMNYPGGQPVLFSSPGDSSPTVVFDYTAETNRQSRNLGPALIRLVSTDIRMIPNKVNGVTDSLPSTILAWVPGAGGDSCITGITPLGKDLSHPSTTNCSDVLIGYFKPLLSDNRNTTFINGTNFMIVNGAWQDTAAASTEWYHLTFNFGNSDFDSLVRLSRDTGRVELVTLTPTGGSTYALDLYLPGGTGDLFAFWDSSDPLATIPEPSAWCLLCAGGVAVTLWQSLVRRAA